MSDTIAAAAPRDPRVSRLELRVRFCETDLMGIVHHANYLVYFEAGRVDWLRRRGISYEVWTQRGVHLPVVEASLRYRRAARFDDVLVVETTCLELTGATVRFGCSIRRDDDPLCEAETLLACVGDDLRPTRIPADLRAILVGGELE